MDVDSFFREPVVCYVLDVILIVYCIIATALYFREKFSYIPPAVVAVPEESARIYQELERPRDADPYQVLEPTKRKKKAAKKRKPKPTSEEERDRDPNESQSHDSARPLPPL
ncbi:high affinity immunoglobulin epsilon receptor subunit gamma-like [Notolabrus celidotus]|uniref:high affinity immunoglobulin epsilon receptor subunit gamma-like n=1 Tax=Notolabrus celidotus TaxID=1203425 RepID=UPI00148FAE3D|nr:high affinity immunoglobulin epsilon receptor subunit gamma-like [Notolabrus celidotus]